MKEQVEEARAIFFLNTTIRFEIWILENCGGHGTECCYTHFRYRIIERRGHQRKHSAFHARRRGSRPVWDYEFFCFLRFLFIQFRRGGRKKRNSGKIVYIRGHYNYFPSYELFTKILVAILGRSYSGTFSAFLAIAFAQMIQWIRPYVIDQCPEKLTVSSLSIHAPQNPALCPFQCKAKVNGYIASLNRRLVPI